eukprot:3336575-Amphidinium_carterae.1
MACCTASCTGPNVCNETSSTTLPMDARSKPPSTWSSSGLSTNFMKCVAIAHPGKIEPYVHLGSVARPLNVIARCTA